MFVMYWLAQCFSFCVLCTTSLVESLLYQLRCSKIARLKVITDRRGATAQCSELILKSADVADVSGRGVTNKYLTTASSYIDR